MYFIFISDLFIVSPSNNIAWLNSAAVFICRFNGETVTGIVNGIRVEDRDDVALIDYDFQRLQIGTYDLAMRVNASEANNNSEIWCQGRGPDVNSSRAQLIVQGKFASSCPRFIDLSHNFFLLHGVHTFTCTLVSCMSCTWST